MDNPSVISVSINYMSIICPYHSTKTCGELRTTLQECKQCIWNEPISYSTVLYEGWQVCPKCGGQGKVWFPPNMPLSETYTSNGIPFECDVCKGEKIIDIKTGLCPSDLTKKKNT